MADVTINELTRGTPAGNNIVPYSTGLNTLGVPVSALFHNAGNIGIGTANPDAPLSFGQGNGERISLYRTNNNYRFGLGVWNMPGTTSFNTRLYGPNYSNAGVQIGTMDQSDGTTFYPALNIISTGNVGIGTVSPARQLTVDSATNPEIGMYTSGTERVKLSTGGSALSQLVIDTAGQPKVIINNIGNMGIGIGAAAPAEKLTVMGNISASGNVKVGSGYIDTTGTTVSLDNNAYIDFPLASGLLIVNAHGPTNGSVSAYLVGGTGVVRLGTSVGVPPYTVTFVNPNPGPPFYRFTNTFGAAQTYGFCFIKTRPYA